MVIINFDRHKVCHKIQLEGYKMHCMVPSVSKGQLCHMVQRPVKGWHAHVILLCCGYYVKICFNKINGMLDLAQYMQGGFLAKAA